MTRHKQKLVERFINYGPLSKKGGMGDLYNLYDVELAREVLAKVVKKEISKIPECMRGFKEEAEISGQLDHPNFRPVYDAGVDEHGELFYRDAFYLLMKKIDRNDFKEALYQKSTKERDYNDLFSEVRVLMKVCDAVAYMHSKKFVHLDLKPENIMLGDFGEVYLIDFGIAKPVRNPLDPVSISDRPIAAEPTTATRIRMAPEQARGLLDCLNGLTDVFLLGTILFEIINRRVPYYQRGISDEESDALARNAAALWPETISGISIPKRLIDIAKKAMQLEQRDRYPSAQALKLDLEFFMSAPYIEAVRTFKKGECIVRQGEPSDAAYLITKGKCRVQQRVGRNTSALPWLTEGDVFGEIGILSNIRRTATVIADTAVTVYVFPRHYFEDHMGEATQKFVKALSDRFVKKEDLLHETESSLKESRAQNEILKTVMTAASKNPGEKDVPWRTLAAMLKQQFNIDEVTARAAAEATGILTFHKTRKGLVVRVNVKEK